MRRHFDAVNGGQLRGLPPAGDAADAFEIGHHVIGRACSIAAAIAAGSEKFSPIWIGDFELAREPGGAGIVVVADRLLQPIDVFRIERAAARQRLVHVERLIVVDHQMHIVADALAHRVHGGDIAAQASDSRGAA